MHFYASEIKFFFVICDILLDVLIFYFQGDVAILFHGQIVQSILSSSHHLQIQVSLERDQHQSMEMFQLSQLPCHNCNAIPQHEKSSFPSCSAHSTCSALLPSKVLLIHRLPHAPQDQTQHLNTVVRSSFFQLQTQSYACLLGSNIVFSGPDTQERRIATCILFCSLAEIEAR